MNHAIKIIVAALALLVAVSAPVAAGPFEDGYAAHEKGDYATALRLLRPLAEGGNSDAQHNLGVMYEKGRGVPQDYAEAVKWYRKAAKRGEETFLVHMTHVG